MNAAPNDNPDSQSPPVGENGSSDAQPVAVTTETETSTRPDEFDVPERLPILPIRDTVAFPGTVMPLEVNREKSKRVLDMALGGSRLVAVVAQQSASIEDPKLEHLFRVGTVCRLLKLFQMPDGSKTVIVHGLVRVGIEKVTEDEGYLEATVHARPDSTETTKEIDALVHTVRHGADKVLERSENIPEEARIVLHGIETPGGLADFLAANLPLGLVHKQELLETFDVTDRLRKANLAVAAQLEILELSEKIQARVNEQIDKSQREYYLREQLKAIKKELGDRDSQDGTRQELLVRIKAAKMPQDVEKEALREVDRLEHIPQVSPEHGTVLDYLDWLVEIPWSKTTKDNLDINRAQEILDEDHYGLEKVKKRILEFLAVRTLSKKSRGPILCFIGPPGVGKTSLGKSIARALGRTFIRLSLGGVRDEAAIRGHRRTYIGAMPGSIVREIRKAGNRNPLFMLDEIDKISGDHRGDPTSALLEVLDPAQNHAFYDHYLGVPLDLTDVFFITTANYEGAIEPALRDRMEMIEFNGYTRREKLNIARKYLFPRQLTENGLAPEQLELSDEILTTIIGGYTREAGVRGLEREIGSVCRSRTAAIVRGEPFDPAVSADDLKDILGLRQFFSDVAAQRALPGVVTGLAFTPVGGEILFIEAMKMPGGGNLNLTGQLGDVMRESGVAAASIIRSRLREWKIDPGVYESYDYHVHVPAGAVPKDGPSAGAAIFTALVSALTGKTVDPRLGMTGEITLSGRILPVGGIREKMLGAHRAGLTRVILPRRNEQDIEDIAEDIREQIEFIFVETINELLAAAFDVPPVTISKRKPRKKAPARKGTRPASAPRKTKDQAAPSGKDRAAKAKAKKTKRTKRGTAPKRTVGQTGKAKRAAATTKTTPTRKTSKPKNPKKLKKAKKATPAGRVKTTAKTRTMKSSKRAAAGGKK